MTRKQILDDAKHFAKLLIENNGYIKGMGSGKYRLMTDKHTPLANIDGQVFNQIKLNGIVYLDHLVYRPLINANPDKIMFQLV